MFFSEYIFETFLLGEQIKMNPIEIVSINFQGKHYGCSSCLGVG